MKHPISVFVIVLLAATGLVSFLATHFEEEIQVNQKWLAKRALQRLLGEQSYTLINTLDSGAQTYQSIDTLRIVHRLRAEKGYSGAIDFLVAHDRDNKIKSIAIVAHRETPGLGDKIEAKKSAWLKQFNNQIIDPNKAFTLRKYGGQIDALSGATVTSRAILDAINTLAMKINTDQQK